MTRRQLLRAFWIGAATILVVAALISIVALVRGQFNETDGEILSTLGLLFLGGSTGIAGLALLERGVAGRLGLATAATAPVWFTVISVYVWNDFSGDALGRWAGSALIALLGSLLVTSSRLLLRTRALFGVYVFEVAMFSCSGAILLWGLWSTSGDQALGKAAATTGILGALAWFLIPVWQRFLAVDASTAQAGRFVAKIGDVEIVTGTGGAVTIEARGGSLVVRTGSGEDVLPPGVTLTTRP